MGSHKEVVSGMSAAAAATVKNKKPAGVAIRKAPMDHGHGQHAPNGFEVTGVGGSSGRGSLNMHMHSPPPRPPHNLSMSMAMRLADLWMDVYRRQERFSEERARREAESRGRKGGPGRKQG
jgi:hypothetical protein